MREQLASCAVAETVDGFLIRPGCLVGAAWLLRPLPGGVWLGFAAGKAAADVAWYGLEASARRGVSWSICAYSLVAACRAGRQGIWRCTAARAGATCGVIRFPPLTGGSNVDFSAGNELDVSGAGQASTYHARLPSAASVTV